MYTKTWPSSGTFERGAWIHKEEFTDSKRCDFLWFDLTLVKEIVKVWCLSSITTDILNNTLDRASLTLPNQNYAPSFIKWRHNFACASLNILISYFGLLRSTQLNFFQRWRIILLHLPLHGKYREAPSRVLFTLDICGLYCTIVSFVRWSKTKNLGSK